MRRPSIVLSISLLAASVAIAGCPWGMPISGQTPPPNDPSKQFNVDNEKQELNALIDSEAVRPYFDPSKLINDGVGIFASDGESEDLLPRRWGRSYPKTVQAASERVVDQMAIDFRTDAQSVLTAEATFSVTRAARFVADFAWQNRLVTKSYNEAAERKARFVKQNGQWRLVSLSPMTLGVTPSGKVSLDLVRLKVDGAAPILIRDGSLLDSSQAPRVKPLQAATVEVHATYTGTSTDQPPYYLFLSLPPGRDRLRLHDDGLAGDTLAGDGLYAATFNFPADTGLHHMVIDAVSSSTFTDLGSNAYDASLWGISYLVQGGEAL